MMTFLHQFGGSPDKAKSHTCNDGSSAAPKEKSGQPFISGFAASSYTPMADEASEENAETRAKFSKLININSFRSFLG